MQFLLEMVATTVDEALRAKSAGASRLELCTALEVGGVTPSPACFFTIREAVPLPIYVLVRPRPGNFIYSTGEFATLQRDAEWFLEQGAAGIVSGALMAKGRIDRGRCAELAKLTSGKIVFHRAFDEIADRMTALEELVDLGFERILTSGGAATACEGRREIAKLMTAARGRIEILPGGGVRPHNAEQILRDTGCAQLHASQWPR
ncbi:MAG TPA: copper homeostasis protein CutC [Urbifossiella sp.]|nr:copper homeostasis protein CutC [Urbifossiella sp.]